MAPSLDKPLKRHRNTNYSQDDDNKTGVFFKKRKKKTTVISYTSYLISLEDKRLKYFV